MPVRVYAPATTPEPILDTIRAVGADLQLIDGHIGDAGKAANAFAASDGYFKRRHAPRAVSGRG
jgi:threonine synthase